MVFDRNQQFDLVEAKQSMGYTGEYEGGGKITLVDLKNDSPPPPYGEVAHVRPELEPVLETSNPKGERHILYFTIYYHVVAFRCWITAFRSCKFLTYTYDLIYHIF